MTNGELELWAWSCLAFGWVFELAGTYSKDSNAYLVAIVLFGIALGFFLTALTRPGGGGPLKPA